MQRISMIVATTRIDRHNEAIAVQALHEMASQIREDYLPLTFEHDIRHPPIGRLVSAEVVEIEDGHYALQATAEVFDEDDSTDSVAGDGRRLKIRTGDVDSIAVVFDRTFRDDDGMKLIRELAEISGKNEKPMETGKKSVEPVSILIITVGAFAVGSIAQGFFSKLGSDVYELLKKSLTKYFRKKRSYEQILDFCFLIKHGERNMEVHLLVVSPSEEKLNSLLASEFRLLDKVLMSLPINQLDIVKVVFEYEDEQISLLYAVTADCVPWTIDEKKEKDNR